jgi:hypothetical protein
MYDDLLWICISVSSQLFPFNPSALVLALVNFIVIDCNLKNFCVLAGGTLCSLICWGVSSILGMKRNSKESGIAEICKYTVFSLIICNLCWVIYYFIITIGKSIRIEMFETSVTVFVQIYIYIMLLIALSLIFPFDRQKRCINTKTRWISFAVVTLVGIIVAIKYARYIG